MKYQNLQALITGSKSSRAYFLSLPVKEQMQLHCFNNAIHTAQQLHEYQHLLKRQAGALGGQFWQQG